MKCSFKGNSEICLQCAQQLMRNLKYPWEECVRGAVHARAPLHARESIRSQDKTRRVLRSFTHGGLSQMHKENTQMRVLVSVCMCLGGGGHNN